MADKKAGKKAEIARKRKARAAAVSGKAAVRKKQGGVNVWRSIEK